jgi:hypothetical protein
VERRRAVAAADLVGQSDVPQTTESGTGASGGFDSSNAENIMGPSGEESGNMSQSDDPQDIQAQLGQVPTLGHKVGAKLAEIAADVIRNNPRLSAADAMTLSLKTLKFYPKVAMGGTDYLTVEPEVLEVCTQCQFEAYNRQVNRCHNCGWYDAGLEPLIEVT